MMTMSKIKRTLFAGCMPSFLLAVCFFSLFALAQTPQTSPQTSTTGAPVLLDNKTVVVIHWGYGNFTPAVRAAGIAARLQSVASSREPLVLTQKPSSLSMDIRCGDIILASAFEGDALAENTTKEALAQQWSDAFLSSMKAYREEYGWRRVALRTALALLTIGLCIWLLFVIRRYTDRMALAASAVVERKVKTSQSKVAALVTDSFLRLVVLRSFGLIRLLLLLVVVALSLHTLLDIFPRTRPLAVSIYQGVAQPTRSFAHSIWVNLPSILFVVILAFITWYLIKLIRYFFQKIGAGAISIQGFRPAWSTVTERLISIAVVVFAVLIAYPYIPGSQSAAFKGVSVFLGILVSLGSTGLVANVITGVMLTYMDAFEVGDLVEIGEITAYIKSTSLLTTRLVTRKNELITVPNSAIVGKHITNFSNRGGKDSILISTGVGIGYETPWRQVEAMLLEAAARTECVAKDPAPFAIIVLLDNYSVNYEINAYLNPGVRRYIGITELNHNVLDVFNEYGVGIMTPSYMSDPAEPKVVPKGDFYAAPADPQQSSVPPKRQYPPTRS